jgi:hypothetical protein
MAYQAYGVGAWQNIAEYLKSYGFTVDYENASDGTRLFDFYDDNRDSVPLTCKKNQADSFRLRQLCNKVKDMVKRGNPPTAILLSAAGNDVVEERLPPLLNPMTAGQPALNDTVVTATVDGLMQCWLEAILDRMTKECVTANGDPIPVFIHGYDFPVPDCRYVFLGAVNELLAWLYPYLKPLGYVTDTYPAYPEDGVSVMQELIGRLNTMQARVAALPRFSKHVFHVKLTGTLSNAQDTYKTQWENELHPKKSGFMSLTKVFATALATNIPALNAQSKGGGLR